MKNKKNLKYLLSGNSTSGEYRNGLDVLIMGDKEYPIYGYKPIEIRNRIEKLLEIERRIK
ncbi:MAG TPA: hypothetical protein VMW95_04695 [Desulfobacterales bacterium]|nr:hypothetical protein [Desulfobacterales bacterium]